MEVLRYANKFVLETSIQIEDKTKIYPPCLVIEYTTVFPNEWDDFQDPKDFILLKIGYSMKTDDMWNTIKTFAGFASAITIGIWIVRVNNWQNRTTCFNENASKQMYSHLKHVVHIIMLGCHTFVWTFSVFIFLICGYWCEHFLYLIKAPYFF